MKMLICLQISSTFGIYGWITSVSYWMNMPFVRSRRQKLRRPNLWCLSRLKLLWKMLTWYKSPGTDQIPAVMSQVRGKILRFEIHGLTNFISNKKELPQQRKESVIIPIYNEDDNDCINYGGILLLPTTYKILSSNLLSSLNSIVHK
jgi:hypothetical protein